MTKAAPRPSMSKARRARIWEKEGGICYLCGKKVQAGELWDAEHVKAWELFHDDSDDNLKVAHKVVCHKEKTDRDLKIIRKADRQGMVKGQAARRAKRGFGLIQSRGFEKPPGYKHQWAKRPWGKNEKDR